MFIVRARQFDDKIQAYIAEHPRASVINLGAGLDTTFYRVDNGLIHWYDLDLPAAIDFRRQLLPEPDRVTYIAKSLLDPSWCKDINTEEGVFMIAGGIFMWFEKSQVQQFFSMLADNFPGGEIVCDVESKFEGWIEQLPPSQREEQRAAWAGTLKSLWDKAPRDKKDKLIATITTSVKPSGTEWADFEAWWNQLSDKEAEIMWRDFMAAYGGVSGWAKLDDVNEFAKWDNRITVLDRFPFYRNIPRESVSVEIRQFMDTFDRNKVMNIIHLRV